VHALDVFLQRLVEFLVVGVELLLLGREVLGDEVPALLCDLL